MTDVSSKAASTPEVDQAPDPHEARFTDERPPWQRLPDDLFSLAFEELEADVILDALRYDDPTACGAPADLIRRLLDVLRLTVRHVDALQDRLDLLPDEACATCGVQRCCCAYDRPDDVCGVHYKPQGTVPMTERQP